MTDILPVVVPVGTEVVMLVGELAVTVAGLLLKKVTELSAGVELKSVPVKVTMVPMLPTAGVKLVMVCSGGGGVALSNF